MYICDLDELAEKKMELREVSKKLREALDPDNEEITLDEINTLSFRERDLRMEVATLQRIADRARYNRIRGRRESASSSSSSSSYSSSGSSRSSYSSDSDYGDADANIIGGYQLQNGRVRRVSMEAPPPNSPQN
ncbi:hypothetical protein SNEBB_006012 [Seison nebaliae]|nr:hypothetical protein SNEBB_006012 [Seison nebaliae]